MSEHFKGKILKTVGWMIIGVGSYLVYKGSELEKTIVVKDYIDVEFEIIE